MWKTKRCFGGREADFIVASMDGGPLEPARLLPAAPEWNVDPMREQVDSANAMPPSEPPLETGELLEDESNRH